MVWITLWHHAASEFFGSVVRWEGGFGRSGAYAGWFGWCATHFCWGGSFGEWKVGDVAVGEGERVM